MLQMPTLPEAPPDLDQAVKLSAAQVKKAKAVLDELSDALENLPAVLSQDGKVVTSAGSASDAVVERIDYLGARPTLHAVASGNTVLFSWSSDAIGYVLEQSSGLGAGLSWTQVTKPPISQNGQLFLSLPLTNPSQFFRLKK